MRYSNFSELILLVIKHGFEVVDQDYFQCDVQFIESHILYDRAVKSGIIRVNDGWAYASKSAIGSILGPRWEVKHRQLIEDEGDVSEEMLDDHFDGNYDDGMDEADQLVDDSSFDDDQYESDVSYNDYDGSDYDDGYSDEYSDEYATDEYYDNADGSNYDTFENSEESLEDEGDSSGDYHLERLKPLPQYVGFMIAMILIVAMLFISGFVDIILFVLLLGFIAYYAEGLYQYIKEHYENFDKIRAGVLLTIVTIGSLVGLILPFDTVEEVVQPQEPIVIVSESVEEAEVAEETVPKAYIDNLHIEFGTYVVTEIGNVKTGSLPVVVENVSDSILKYHIGVQAYDATGAEIGDVYYLLGNEFMPKNRQTLYGYELYRYYDLEEAAMLSEKLSAPGVTYKVVDISTWE